MANVSSSIDTSAAPAHIWALVSDPLATPRWLSNHVGYVGDVPGALDAGAEYTQQVRVLGMPAEVRWSVQTSVAPQEGPGRLASDGAGPMGISLSSVIVVEPAESGSRVTLEQEFSGGAVMAVGPQLEREVKTVQETSLATLRDLAQG